jgi:hypothetical protein
MDEDIVSSVEDQSGTRQKLYPYHVKKVHCLQPGDLPRRQEFCEWILTQDEAQPNF